MSGDEAYGTEAVQVFDLFDKMTQITSAVCHGHPIVFSRMAMSLAYAFMSMQMEIAESSPKEIKELCGKCQLVPISREIQDALELIVKKRLALLRARN